MKEVRTRFAPSPTGFMHLGGVRTALYNYLYAKKMGGKFILRIEDTDQERFVEGALDIIYHTMEQTGLDYDEGPDKPGDCGPYVQSERVASGLYMEYAKKLVIRKEAYYCFCDKERLESLRTTIAGKEIMMYDKHCLHLSQEEVEANLAAGKPFVIRQNIPDEGTTTFRDDIYGAITVENKELDDMVLIKSDGYPTYNFANVVDDHLMGITHVVRGNEYLSSTPKYIRLYDAFGWEAPVFVHLPLITDEEHHKLSKRSGHSSFEDLTDQGFLPEAIVNYVALLGWSPEDNEEIFNMQQLIQAFDYRRVNKSPAVFDMVKLRWMNGEYIKNLDDETYRTCALPYILKVFTHCKDASVSWKDLDKVMTSDGAVLPKERIGKILELMKTRIEVFPDIPEKIDFFDCLPEYDTAMYTHKKMKTDSENSLEVLKEILPILEALEDYSFDVLHDRIMKYISEKGVKNGVVLWPLRIAVSGKQNTPGGAFEILEILGKEESLRRIRIGIEKLEHARS
mgnify:CR=1 FL=1